MGSIIETGTAFPGNTGQIPDDVAPLAEMLRLNGYSTGAFGKWHELAAWEASVSGPFDRWPTRQGFDKFYGFLGGETNQWAPFIYDGVHPVELPENPNYHFLTDMTDQTVAWIKYQKALTPEKPFFVYFAPGATHAPHHVPKEWIARWKGKFDQWGGPETYPHMAAGWAVSFDTPYQWTKQVGSDFGGTKVGMAVHWPKGIKAKGELRTQFHHVIDVAPT